MDQQKLDAFAERVSNQMLASTSILTLYLGHRLNLFSALAEAGPVTSAEFAARTGHNERYLREWLGCMAVGDYLDYDSASMTFSLPPEHATALLDIDNLAYIAPQLCSLPGVALTLEQLMEAFRKGGGVPFEAYGPDIREAISMGNRPMFVNDYVAKWIPELPDIQGRLEAGERAAEIGCGEGWASISLARGFPKVLIDAVDIDAASIDQARRNAAEAGVGDRVKFHLAAVEDAALDPPYALVAAFECLHDMAYPVQVLRRMRELAAPYGAVLIADEAVGETIEENRNFLGQYMYNVSVLHCLPQAMVFRDAAGTGTVMSASLLGKYAQEAGFKEVKVLPIENPFWRFYRLAA